MYDKSESHPKNDIYIGINYGHDGTVTVIFRGKIVFYSEEERINHKKSTYSFAQSLHNAYCFVIKFRQDLQKQLKQRVKVRVGMSSICTGVPTTDDLRFSKRVAAIYTKDDVNDLLYPYFREIICLDDYDFARRKLYRYYVVEHHDAHSALAFHRSGFDEALCISIDGGGAGYMRKDEYLKETDTISYRKGGHVEYIERTGILIAPSDVPMLHRAYIPKGKYDNELIDGWSYGMSFSRTADHLFGDKLGAGKVMGLSAYGKPNKLLDGVAGDAFQGRRPRQNFLKNAFVLHGSGKVSGEDLAYKIQKQSGDAVIKYVKHALKYKPETKNICCSGGFFYNIINNQKLIKEFPHINFYFEPMCGDVGISTGCALREYYRLTNDKKKRPIETLYIGTQANYDRDLQEGETEYEVTPAQVAKLIEERNVVAIYQGRAEAGPRALGNRSILYDPRDSNGRDRVNNIKKREKFRPFAGTVMEEHAHEWFDMMNQKSSPYMMIAFDTLPDKRDLVPALQHNDGTSRIQTLNRKQNKNYYDLINEFYKLTGVPMVLNTSFNLAGDTMVDNMQDALWTCRNGNIPYLYCPERQMIIDFTGRKDEESSL